MKKNKENSMLEFEFDPYQPDSVPLFEALYGNHLISLGGLVGVDNMFSDLNITGLKALEIGFGLGGAAFYLAEKYQMNIAGLEIHPWMVKHAQHSSPINLTSHLEFTLYQANGEFPFRPETFDLCYSKGVLNHIADKESLFKQVNKILKPNGLFVIADWIFPNVTAEQSSPLVCETKASYELVLTKTGFTDIQFRDDSESFLGYVKTLLGNLTKHEVFIKQQYGEAVFSTIRNQHEDLIEKIIQKQKLAVRIIAKKSEQLAHIGLV